MKLALILASLIGFGDYTNHIALEMAKHKLKPSVVEKVARSQCTKCKGTGKVKAGDGVTIVERECDACWDDGKAKKAVGDAVGQGIDFTIKLAQLIPKPSKSGPEPPQEKPKMDLSKGREKRILAFGAKWCANCAADTGTGTGTAPLEILATQYRLKVGSSVDDDVQHIDVDEFPELAKQLNVGDSLPCYILTWKGKEIERLTGRRSAPYLAGLYNRRVTNQYLRNWCRTYKGEPSEVQGMSVTQHLITGGEGHEGGPFTYQQVYGLTLQELKLVHSGQHAGVLTPFGAVK